MGFKLSFPTGYEVENKIDDNIDVNIVLDNGDVYFGAFFSIENVRRLLMEDGFSFWSEDMIIVELIDLEIIKNAVAKIVSDGQVGFVFSKIGSETQVFGNPPKYRTVIMVD